MPHVLDKAPRRARPSLVAGSLNRATRRRSVSSAETPPTWSGLPIHSRSICVPRLANAYLISRHPYSAICVVPHDVGADRPHPPWQVGPRLEGHGWHRPPPTMTLGHWLGEEAAGRLGATRSA